jgi:subtilase family serine protease
LSADSVIDGSDTLLGSRAVGSLDVGVASSGSATVTIPASTPPGTYYLIAKADGDGTQPETSETNNTYARSIVIGTDLVVSTLTVPAKGGAGSTISVSDTTTNSGGGTATASVTRFYLSSNSTLDATDTLLAGAHAVPVLSAGGSHSASTSLTLPAVATGTYYVIARADDDNVVVESKETNNTLAKTIVIGSNLAVTAFTAPALAGAGAPLTVTDTTTNQGGGPVDPTTTKFYLSANNVLDGSDTLLGSRAVPALAAGAASSGSTTVMIPSAVATGSYYLIAKADADDTATETVESDNTATFAVKIGSDLSIPAITLATRAAAGSAIVVTDTTSNQGGGDAPPSVTAFYLSTSGTGTTGDVLLDGNRAVPLLAAGTSSVGSTTVTIPSGTVSGIFYIIAKADDGNAVSETNETNNSRSRSITIGPDLTFTSLSLSPTSLPAGANLTVSDTVRNQGAGIAAASTTRFYLSTNTSLDGGDGALMPSRAVPQLADGASSSGSTSVNIPSNTAPGLYYVIAQADSDGVVAESSETNNVAVIRSIQVTGP